MLSTSPDPAVATFGASLLLAAYLTYLYWTPPNTPTYDIAAALPRDNMRISTRAIDIKRFVTASLWILYSLLSVLFPSPPIVLYPNLDNLESYLFTWSTYTAVAVGIIILAALIRLLAFR